MSETRQTVFRQTPSEYKKLKNDAYAHRMNISEYIRWLIEKEHMSILNGGNNNELPLIYARKAGCAEYFADYLIAHGVTAQEWISVKDRLPELNEIVLAALSEPNKRLNHPYEEKTLLLFRRGYNYITGYEEKWERPFGAETRDYNDEVTYWMPLPEPPHTPQNDEVRE